MIVNDEKFSDKVFGVAKGVADLKNFQPIPNTDVIINTVNQSRNLVVPAGDGTNLGAGNITASFTFPFSKNKLFDFGYSVYIDGQWNPTSDPAANQMANFFPMYAINPGTGWIISRNISGENVTLTFDLFNRSTSPVSASISIREIVKG